MAFSRNTNLQLGFLKTGLDKVVSFFGGDVFSKLQKGFNIGDAKDTQDKILTVKKALEDLAKTDVYKNITKQETAFRELGKTVEGTKEWTKAYQNWERAVKSGSVNTAVGAATQAWLLLKDATKGTGMVWDPKEWKASYEAYVKALTDKTPLEKRQKQFEEAMTKLHTATEKAKKEMLGFMKPTETVFSMNNVLTLTQPESTSGYSITGFTKAREEISKQIDALKEEADKAGKDITPILHKLMAIWNGITIAPSKGMLEIQGVIDDTNNALRKNAAIAALWGKGYDKAGTDLNIMNSGVSTLLDLINNSDTQTNGHYV